MLAAMPHLLFVGAAIATAYVHSPIEPRYFELQPIIEDMSAYTGTSAGRSLEGMRLWYQSAYPTDQDFSKLALGLLERQISLGPEIERILATHLSDLYE